VSETALRTLPFPPHHPTLTNRHYADLLNVFEVFLPQLLLYPNAADPLNGEAAALYLKDPERFKDRVRDHIRRHATPKDDDDDMEGSDADQKDDDERMDELSDLSSLASDGERAIDDTDELLFD
jgi:ubiquitin-conjugating enzyme E2 H